MKIPLSIIILVFALFPIFGEEAEDYSEEDAWMDQFVADLESLLEVQAMADSAKSMQESAVFAEAGKSLMESAVFAEAGKHLIDSATLFQIFQRIVFDQLYVDFHAEHHATLGPWRMGEAHRFSPVGLMLKRVEEALERGDVEAAAARIRILPATPAE